MASEKKHSKNHLLIMVAVAVVAVVIGFCCGIQYQKSQISSVGAQFQNTRNGQGNFQRRNGGARPVSGEVLSQDDKSITVKMQDGSTKIVILSDKTVVNKASVGSKSDLKNGERVTAFGTENSDGSITAQNISIGGGMMMLRGGMQR